MSVTNFFGIRVLDVDAPRLRVLLRVLVVNYEYAEGRGDALLPYDHSFFFRVLFEASDDVIAHRFGPLTDVVTFGEYFDDDWVDRNTHHFVADVERVAGRNLTVDDDAWEWLEEYDGEYDGHGWPEEGRLVQGDFEVTVTDPRWLESLRTGDCWDTGNYATHANPFVIGDVEERYARQAEGGSMDACFKLGWLRGERGDASGAAELYRRVAEGSKTQLHGKALLYLGDLLASQGEHEAACAAYERAERTEAHEHYRSRHHARAALRRSVLLRGLGRAEEAQAAFDGISAMPGADRDQSLAEEMRRLHVGRG